LFLIRKFLSIQFLRHYVTLTDTLEPRIDHKTYSMAARLIAAFDEKREIARFGRYADTNLSICRGSVLVFLPGLEEIEAMHKVLLVSNCFGFFHLRFVHFVFKF